ncbi:hypothetical protein GW17_00014692 [Ensete ventricosum]|nr:hypothetical protein GW17_00014692 [Ensete ventricosum]
MYRVELGMKKRLLPEKPAWGDLVKPQRRIEIGRWESSIGFQVLPFLLSLLLPLLLSPLADTSRNRPTTVEIDHYSPTTASDGRNQPIPTDFRW